MIGVLMWLLLPNLLQIVCVAASDKLRRNSTASPTTVEWTTAIRNHDTLKVTALLMTPVSLSDKAYNKSITLETLLSGITSYYMEIISNKTYVDHVGAFEKLYTFFADSMFLLPPPEVKMADTWFTERQSYTVTPVPATAFMWLDAAHGNMTRVGNNLSRIQELVAEILPVLHDLGHTDRDTKKLKCLAARFLDLAIIPPASEFCRQTKNAIHEFNMTWAWDL